MGVGVGVIVGVSNATVQLGEGVAVEVIVAAFSSWFPPDGAGAAGLVTRATGDGAERVHQKTIAPTMSTSSAKSSQGICRRRRRAVCMTAPHMKQTLA